jgi:hypothetical protein
MLQRVHAINVAIMGFISVSVRSIKLQISSKDGTCSHENFDGLHGTW